MKKFEYRLEQFNMTLNQSLNTEQHALSEQLTTILNEYGKDGWRLCGVDGTWYYFAREIKEKLTM